MGIRIGSQTQVRRQIGNASPSCVVRVLYSYMDGVVDSGEDLELIMIDAPVVMD